MSLLEAHMLLATPATKISLKERYYTNMQFILSHFIDFVHLSKFGRAISETFFAACTTTLL